jgi:hypothetical protein
MVYEKSLIKWAVLMLFTFEFKTELIGINRLIRNLSISIL